MVAAPEHGIDPTEVPVKDAATVLFLRDAPGGLEVFAVRRAPTMVFAGGMIAFPGGGVDPSDSAPFPSIGPSLSTWAARLGIETSRAGTILSAAIRECFEETGLLLSSEQVSIAADGARPGSPWPSLRARVASHEIALAEVLGATGHAADTGRLHALGRWVTPVGPPRRYDTFFFGVEVETDGPHQPVGDFSEFDRSSWARPADLLDAHRREEIFALPPTRFHLEMLADAGSAAEVLAVERDLRAVRLDRPATRSRKLGES